MRNEGHEDYIRRWCLEDRKAEHENKDTRPTLVGKRIEDKEGRARVHEGEMGREMGRDGGRKMDGNKECALCHELLS